MERGAPLPEMVLSGPVLFERARNRLGFDIPPVLTDAALIPARGDGGADEALRMVAREKPIRPAAVLVPIVDRDEPTVLLTQRAVHLSDHPGQVAFPGGKLMPGETPLDAALREAEEEIGLDRGFVDPLGYLDVYGNTFGFRIVPTLARIKPGFDLRLDKNEVDEAFEVPLSFLMRADNHVQHDREYRGLRWKYYAMPYEQRHIWGTTAGILRNLYEWMQVP